jgi:methylated-DNA-[protein]-cysteine S-methyltransferase
MKYSSHIVQASFESPLGRMVLAANRTHLVGVWFDGQRHQPKPSDWPVDPSNPLLQRAAQQLSGYFEKRHTAFDLPLDLTSGTPFQQAIWRALLKIPVGQTSTYGALSACIGKPGAARAAGGAVGRNPFSVIIPCHRIIGVGGALTGYAGGLERKVALLKLEST